MDALRFGSRRKLPVILQQERAECGHACVAMIASFWGHPLDLYGLRRIHHPSLRGTSLRQLRDILQHLGFKTRALRVSLPDVHFIKTPAILHWNMNHFVVLKKVKRNKMIVHDPAVGMRVCSMAECNHSFTGIVLEVEQAADFKTIRSGARLSLRALLKKVTGMSRLLGLSFFLSLMMESMRILNPLLMQYITDDILGSDCLNQMYAIGIGFTLFALLQAVVEYTRSHFVLYVRMHLTAWFTTNTFKHLLSLPLSFFERRHPADIHAKFQSIEHIKNKLGMDFVSALLDGTMLVITLGIMFIYSGLLSMLVLIAIAVYISIRWFSLQRYKEQHTAAIALHAKSTASFVETLQAMLPIKCYLKENMRFNLWQDDYIDALNYDIQVARLQIRYQVLNQLLFQLEHIMVLCIGAGLVFSKQLSIGMLLAFLAYRLMVVNKVSSFIQHLFDYQLIAVQLSRLDDLITQEPEFFNTKRAPLHEASGTICLKNISFSYHKDAPLLLHNISFEVYAGEKLAIVGPSGSGKSTLLKIIMGIQAHTAGDILIGDLPLALFGIQNFRAMSAAVMQEDTLFMGSIVDNITLFAEEVDMDRIYRVAGWADIHALIVTLPMGYNTLLGPMGSSLSGGQKQRLLLARALYQEPKFLFLDEATSHLDARSEEAIHAALQALPITQIMVAHRQETISMADRVIRLG